MYCLCTTFVNPTTVDATTSGDLTMFDNTSYFKLKHI